MQSAHPIKVRKQLKSLQPLLPCPLNLNNGRLCNCFGRAASLRFSQPDAAGLFSPGKDYSVMRRRVAVEYALIVVEMVNGKGFPDRSLAHWIKSLCPDAVRAVPR